MKLSLSHKNEDPFCHPFLRNFHFCFFGMKREQSSWIITPISRKRTLFTITPWALHLTVKAFCFHTKKKVFFIYQFPYIIIDNRNGPINKLWKFFIMKANYLSFPEHLNTKNDETTVRKKGFNLKKDELCEMRGVFNLLEKVMVK